MTRNIITILILIFTIHCSPQTFNWDKGRKLNWEDFKGPVKNWDVAAASYCGISVKTLKTKFWNGKSKYLAYAEFDCDSSFYNPKRINKNVLSHEQLHFDISELYARKINQVFAKKGFIQGEEASKIYDSINLIYSKRQSVYEKETEFGTIIDKQEIWNQRIFQELKELENFTN